MLFLMNALKETYVKYTTKINSNSDKTINIKSTNGANVTNVYDGDTGKFKYCYDHNSDRVKTYQHNGKIYKYYDSQSNNQTNYHNGYQHNSNHIHYNGGSQCAYYNGYRSKSNYLKRQYYK